MASASSMLVGDITPFAAVPASSCRYRSSPKALTDLAASLAAAGSAAARATTEWASSIPAIGADVVASHAVPSWSATATQPSATASSSVTDTGRTRYHQ
jgi:hypothetical protein